MSYSDLCMYLVMDGLLLFTLVPLDDAVVFTLLLASSSLVRSTGSIREDDKDGEDNQDDEGDEAKEEEDEDVDDKGKDNDDVNGKDEDDGGSDDDPLSFVLFFWMCFSSRR
jgi:hypothetical protein